MMVDRGGHGIALNLIEIRCVLLHIVSLSCIVSKIDLQSNKNMGTVIFMKQGQGKRQSLPQCRKVVSEKTAI